MNQDVKNTSPDRSKVLVLQGLSAEPQLADISGYGGQ
jgi:hypothetical protein